MDDWQPTTHSRREDVLTKECVVFVPILSTTYEESDWCVGELKMALNHARLALGSLPTAKA